MPPNTLHVQGQIVDHYEMAATRKSIDQVLNSAPTNMEHKNIRSFLDMVKISLTQLYFAASTT